MSEKDVTFFRAMNHPLVYGPLLLGAAVLYGLPSGWIEETPLIGALPHWLGARIPSIDQAVRYSKFPQEARAFLSLTMFLAPVQIAVALIRLHRGGYAEYQLAYWRRLPLSQLRMLRWVGPVLVVGGTLAFLMVGEDPNICDGCTSRSRLGLLFFGGIAPLGIGVVAYVSFLLLVRFGSLEKTTPYGLGKEE